MFLAALFSENDRQQLLETWLATLCTWRKLWQIICIHTSTTHTNGTSWSVWVVCSTFNQMAYLFSSTIAKTVRRDGFRSSREYYLELLKTVSLANCTAEPAAQSHATARIRWLMPWGKIYVANGITKLGIDKHTSLFLFSFFFSFFFFFFLSCFNSCIVPLKYLPMEIRVAFPGESQLRKSFANQLIVHAGCFSVLRNPPKLYKLNKTFSKIFSEELWLMLV